MKKVNMPSTRFDASKETFVTLLNEAATERYKVLDKNHTEYLEKELKLINNVPDEWVKTLLITADLITAMKQKYPHCISNGHGAIVASFAAYLLRITEIDPVGFNLQPERFYVGAKTMPIPFIDIEIASQCKQDAIEYLMDTYGKQNVFGCFNNKGFGIHPCALFISQSPYTDVEYIEGSPYPVSTKTVDELEAAGFMRINIISSNIQHQIMELATTSESEFNLLNVISNTCYSKLFNSADNSSILYGKLVHRYKNDINSFNDIVNLVAISHKKTYGGSISWMISCMYSKNESYGDKNIDLLLSDTNGYILYQEQICNILQYVLDVDYATVHEFRKAIAKRNMSKVRSLFVEFVKILTERGMNPTAVMRLWNDLVRATNDAMTRSHCVAEVYSLIEHVWLTNICK